MKGHHLTSKQKVKMSRLGLYLSRLTRLHEACAITWLWQTFALILLLPGSGLAQISMHGAEVKLPLNFSSNEVNMDVYSGGSDGRYLLCLGDPADSISENLFLVDFFARKVLFSERQIKSCNMIGNHSLIYLSSSGNLYQYSVFLGQAHLLLKEVSCFTVLGSVLHIIQKDNIYSMELSTEGVVMKETAKSVEVMNAVTYLYALDERILLLFNAGVCCIWNSAEGRCVNQMELKNTIEEKDLIKTASAGVYIKMDSGYCQINADPEGVVEIRKYVKWEDGSFMNSLANCGKYLVYGNQFSGKLWMESITSQQTEQREISFPEPYNADRLWDIIGINDTLIILVFKWNPPLLLHTGSGNLKPLPLPPAIQCNYGSAAGGKYITGIETEGIFCYDVIRNKKEKPVIGLSAIRQAYLHEGKLLCLKFYADAGTASVYRPAALLEYSLPDMRMHLIDSFPEDMNTDDKRYQELFGTLKDRRKFLPLEVANGIITLTSDEDTVKVLIADNLQDFICINQASFYMASKQMVKHLRFFSNKRLISMEQVDLVYNRPDKIIESWGHILGNVDSVLCNAYRDALQRRYAALAIDDRQFNSRLMSLPEVVIAHGTTIPSLTEQQILRICVQAADSQHAMKRFNILVNEVPLYGSEGYSIPAAKAHAWDSCLEISLSSGMNNIQFQVVNDAGFQNYRSPLFLEYKPSLQTGIFKIHFIGIAVDSFQQSNFNLRYCVSDVMDMAEYFRKNTPAVNIKLVVNHHTVRGRIADIKKYLKDSTDINDCVVILCSSHGLLDDSMHFYLATHDIDFSRPWEKGISYNDLLSLLDGIPARKKLLMLDACNSGAAEPFPKSAAGGGQGITSSAVASGIRGAKVRNQGKPREEHYLSVSDVFLQVGNKTGSVVISAAGAREQAFEGVTANGVVTQNGAFTYSILEYLNMRTVNTEKTTVQQLKSYVERRVVALTGGKQRPASRQENLEVDWQLL